MDKKPKPKEHGARPRATPTADPIGMDRKVHESAGYEQELGAMDSEREEKFLKNREGAPVKKSRGKK